MATEVIIPKLGMTMKEGTIVEWVVADGARVERDQVLLELATDKLDTDVTAEVSGTLRHRFRAGETHPVSTVIGWILDDGEALPADGSGKPRTDAELLVPAAGNGNGRPDVQGSGPGGGDGGRIDRRRVVSSPYARRLARERGVDLVSMAGTGPGGRIVAADVPLSAPRTGAVVPAATPVARRLADRLGVDLRSIIGSGPAGRITKEDVEASAATLRGNTVPPDRPPADALHHESTDGAVIPLRGMRRVIAERMHHSLQEMAQLTLGMEVDMTAAASLRGQLLDEWQPEGVRVSFTDLVCRAAVKALGMHPGLNASVESEVIRRHPQINLGVAVAVSEGLLVPVVTGADRLSLQDLSVEVAVLAAAARAGTISMDALDGATFTVTALGSSGIDFFTPVVNPPNVAILGVGRLHDGVAWEGDQPRRRQVMTLSLTIDHRAVDGAPGAAFLTTVRELLESPYRLLV